MKEEVIAESLNLSYYLYMCVKVNFKCLQGEHLCLSKTLSLYLLKHERPRA